MNVEPQNNSDHETWMRAALSEAEKAFEIGEVPVGAVLIKDGKLLASAHNLTVTHHDPRAHAEMLAIGEAAKLLNNERLENTTLFVTLEPCAMCAGAIVWARIPTIVFGAWDPRAGACGSVFKVIPNMELNHRPSVFTGVLKDEAVAMLQKFFKAKR